MNNHDDTIMPLIIIIIVMYVVIAYYLYCSWDVVLVFPIYACDAKTTKKQNNQSLKYILNRLADGGLETKQFYSIQKDELYVKIRAPINRLMREADRVDLKLKMNDLQLENALREGRADKGWGPIQFPSPMETIETEIEACQYIYAAYEYDTASGTTREDLACLFQKYGDGDSIFRGVDRIKLIQTIIAARLFEGGCQLDVHKLTQQGNMLGFSPIHDYVELRGLEEGWLRFIQFPWKQRCDDVKDYFGEKIGMYFLFLGHYTTWLIPASVMGFIAYIDVSAEGDDPSAPVLPYFAVFMSIWSTLMLEYWSRKEKL